MSNQKTTWQWGPDSIPAREQRHDNWSSSSEQETRAIHSPSPSGADAAVGGETKLVWPSAEGSEQEQQRERRVNDPVVGWLVVIKGPGLGASLQLGVGNNPIGREPGQRVLLNFGDDMISRCNQASVLYDDRNRSFFIQHGTGKNLTRLNGQLVCSLMPLAAGDRIELSPKTELRFVPFCDEEFDWADHL